MGQFYQTLCAKIVTGSQCSVKNLQVSPTFFCHVESATKSGEFCQIFGPFAKLHASKKIFSICSHKKSWVKMLMKSTPLGVKLSFLNSPASYKRARRKTILKSWTSVQFRFKQFCWLASTIDCKRVVWRQICLHKSLKQGFSYCGTCSTIYWWLPILKLKLI